jgi:hypothetical protein
MNGQIFVIAGVGTMTYGMMKGAFDDALLGLVIRAESPEVFASVKDGVTEAQRDELAAYMRVFMADVEHEYLEKKNGTGTGTNGPPATEDPERGG